MCVQSTIRVPFVHCLVAALYMSLCLVRSTVWAEVPQEPPGRAPDSVLVPGLVALKMMPPGPTVQPEGSPGAGVDGSETAVLEEGGLTAVQGDDRAGGDEKSGIVAFGDSTTAARGSLVVYASRLEHLFEGLGRSVRVINAGVPGNTTEDGRARFQQDVLDRHPEWVIVQFGINDSAIDVWRDPPAREPRISRARYRENLRYFLKELAARDIHAVLMTPNPMRWAAKTRELYDKPPYDRNDPDGFNVLLRDYAKAVREVAAEAGVPLVDVYAVFQAYDAVEGQSMDELLLDGMHPNDKGHAMVAELLGATLAR